VKNLPESEDAGGVSSLHPIPYVWQRSIIAPLAFLPVVGMLIAAIDSISITSKEIIAFLRWCLLLSEITLLLYSIGLLLGLYYKDVSVFGYNWSLVPKYQITSIAPGNNSD
jgi:hypothetical protein